MTSITNVLKGQNKFVKNVKLPKLVSYAQEMLKLDSGQLRLAVKPPEFLNNQVNITTRKQSNKGVFETTKERWQLRQTL